MRVEKQATLEGLVPGIGITIQALDWRGVVIAAKDVTTPSGVVDVEVELRLPGEDVVIEGVVFDSAGRPLVNATVRCAASILDGETHDAWLELLGSQRVDRPAFSALDGRFRIDGVHALEAHLALEITHELHAPARVLVPAAQSSEVSVRLEAARDVEVELVDAEGRGVEGAELEARAEGMSVVGGEPVDGRPGRYRFTRVVSRTIDVTCALGARRVSVAVVATEQSARFVLPASGLVDLSASVPENIDPRSLRIRCVHPGEPELVLRGSLGERFRADRVRLPVGTWQATFIDATNGAVLAGPTTFEVVSRGTVEVRVAGS